MGQMASYADRLRDGWMQHTWINGQHPDASMLTDLRARADAHLALSEIDYKRLLELSNGNDPKPE